MVIMMVGIVVSLLLGALIGIWSKTQMMATSITVPVMMFFSFMPMLSMFNTTIAGISKVIYSEQISIILHQIHHLQLQIENIFIIVANVFLFAVLFAAVYKKKGFE